jgi:hypothetical protein
VLPPPTLARLLAERAIYKNYPPFRILDQPGLSWRFPRREKRQVRINIISFLCGPFDVAFQDMLCAPSAEFILSLAEGLRTCFAGDIPILLVAASPRQALRALCGQIF